MENIVIQTTPRDNVGIVVNPSGLRKDTVVSGGIALREDIPMGHKVALKWPIILIVRWQQTQIT